MRKKPHKGKRVRCTLYVSNGTLKRNGHAGANHVPFSGRIGNKALKPGSYKATIVATNAGGRSIPKTVTFKIVTA